MTKNNEDKSSHFPQIPEREHTADAESTNLEDGKEKDPNVMQGYPIGEEETPIIGDLYRKRIDGITTDTHEENRVSAEDKEEPTKSVGTQKRKRRRRI